MNMIRGRDLGKAISYIFLILAVLGLIGTIVSYFHMIADLKVSFLLFIVSTVIYLIYFFAIYFTSTRVASDSLVWKIYLVLGIIVFLTFFSILGLILAIFLFIAAYDVRKEQIKKSFY